MLEADSPEECDAWDVWVEELETVRQLLLNVWKEAEVRLASLWLTTCSERPPGPRKAHFLQPTRRKP